MGKRRLDDQEESEGDDVQESEEEEEVEEVECEESDVESEEELAEESEEESEAEDTDSSPEDVEPKTSVDKLELALLWGFEFMAEGKTAQLAVKESYALHEITLPVGDALEDTEQIYDLTFKAKCAIDNLQTLFDDMKKQLPNASSKMHIMRNSMRHALSLGVAKQLNFNTARVA